MFCEISNSNIVSSFFFVLVFLFVCFFFYRNFIKVSLVILFVELGSYMT